MLNCNFCSYTKKSRAGEDYYYYYHIITIIIIVIKLFFKLHVNYIVLRDGEDILLGRTLYIT